MKLWKSLLGAGSAGLLLVASATTAARAAELPPGAPPGVCAAGGPYGPPLSAATTTAPRLAGGRSFLEGPVWLADQGTLLMSDMAAASGPQRVQPSSIVRYVPGATTIDTAVADAGSNGLALAPDGRSIVAATHDQRSVSRYEIAGFARSTIATGYRGAAFNSPNDVAVRSDGVIYVTDPDFQRGARPDAMAGRTGVFRISGGVVSLVDDGLREPNGIALSPDGGTLYVGAYGENTIYRYPVLADGSTGTRTVFASVGGPDGVTIDCAGNVYWASGADGRVHVFTPAGAPLGTIVATAGTTNVAFGGPDRQTLFITSGRTGASALYGVHLGVPGYPY
ncbi:SMP-30/gluconolactonase/LRE family protein [Actinoplanes sp. N902-109]|uniref:SMP-30/gluconolactonase/LRE family protein n=1 Tax=Actinoplanes sp. (strain N902-109) TaxID=649831 RepID=UPI0003296288|nr:SMP-30/gluconolactonase/LRE family protein [Actinoplanes sp. N902-109]AGL16688.1 gluconolactonase [Actinoplanes sp. N902-109]